MSGDKVSPFSPEADQAQTYCAEARGLLSQAAETRESAWMLEAIGYYADAMLLAPDLVEPYLELGHLWLYFEQPEQAMPFLRKALDLEPFNSRAQRLWADACALLEAPPEQS